MKNKAKPINIVQVGDVVDFEEECDTLKCTVAKIRDDGWVDLDHWETQFGYEMEIKDIKHVYRRIEID